MAEDHGIWITPFGGYRLSGSVKLEDPNFSKVDLSDSSVYGLSAGMQVPEGLLELAWTHQANSARAIPLAGGPPMEGFDLHVDQFHFNGLYLPPEFEHVKPYAIAGLGFTRYAPVGDAEALDKFSWALGGGVHIPLTSRLGLRLEGKWDPALVSSSGGVFCNSTTGRCYVAAAGDLIDQFDFTAGLTLHI